MGRRDLIFNNLAWKITSFFLAVIVWFVVQRSVNSDDPWQTLMVNRHFATHELSVMRDVTDKRSIRVNPAQVDITVSVPAINRTFTESDIQTYIDFSNNQNIQRPFRIRVFLPSDVKLISIKPEQAFIEVID